MGKRTKLREAQRREDELALAARLRLHGGAKRRPAFINSYGEFPSGELAKIEAYRHLALRQPEDWRCELRVRAPELRFLDLVKFAFARFSAPAHLEREWLGEWAPEDGDTPDFRLWHIISAQGGSLYREASHHLLSRAETHHFLAAPAAVQSAGRAVVYAVARARSDDGRIALSVARSKLADFGLGNEFWMEVVRFFARNPTGVNEMNDLIDFIRAEKAQDPRFSLAGRTLPALRRRMEEWHELLRKNKELSRERWAGKQLPNALYRIGELIWRFRQIKNSIRLFEEGSRMHHCVLTYKDRCVAGSTSIWALSCENEGVVRPRLTIEVDNFGWIVQARGFANRAPTAEECEALARWADEFGPRGSGYAFGA
jgi:hypothetical protein